MKELVAVMQYKVPKCSRPAVISGFCGIDDAVLLELDAQQIRDLFWVTMPAIADASKDGCIKELVALSSAIGFLL